MNRFRLFYRFKFLKLNKTIINQQLKEVFKIFYAIK